jgi:hypothetical protein
VGTGEGGRRPDEGKRRTGEGRGENFNNQVAEILPRSRKVRSQILNKTNFVTARDDGAKGQRPCKAGPGPDWSPLPGTGAGADAIIMAQRSKDERRRRGRK